MASHRLTLGAIDFAEWRQKQPSQAAAAALIKLSQQTVSKIEGGRYVPSDWQIVERIRVVCGIAPDRWLSLSKRRRPPKRQRSDAPRRAA